MKKVENADISVEWYFEPRWRDITPERITIKRGKEEYLIFEASDAIVDLNLRNDSIIIKLFKPYRAIIYTENPPKKVFEYIISIDTTGSENDYRNTPMVVKVYD